VSDRHFGIGSDGLILIAPSSVADVGMRIFNADGSEAQMCGNGIRCVAKYAYDHGLCHKEEMTVETRAGIRTIRLFVRAGVVLGATVNMGRPRLRRSEIPMKGRDSERVVNEKLAVGRKTLRVTCVNMGNPHCVVPVQSVAAVDLCGLGPRIENHRSFPERTNVHFVEALSRKVVRVATWERGSGVTLACGTGASAVCVAMSLLGRTGRRVLAHLPGGDLELDWRDADDCVYMTGPAVEVFTGEWIE
jgi:diaminopimelate epimerase